jgi:hypothetical protein
MKQNKFERENRYIVLKEKDTDFLSPEDYDVFTRIVEEVEARTKSRKGFIPDYVVVESDWPEYEPVWHMIKTRTQTEESQKLENNIYKSHLDAEDSITDFLTDEARNDCEIAGEFGSDSYTQLYKLVDDERLFCAVLEVEYNRHDKTYYYVDGRTYSYIELKKE